MKSLKKVKENAFFRREGTTPLLYCTVQIFLCEILLLVRMDVVVFFYYSLLMCTNHTPEVKYAFKSKMRIPRVLLWKLSYRRLIPVQKLLISPSGDFPRAQKL